MLGKGSGLGLSTVLAIVKKHGGFVRVETEVGKGSVFRVFIPAAEEGAVAVPRIAEVPLPKGNGELVLVVDDETAICSLLRRTLERQNYRVVTANDGREGLELFRSHRSEVRLVITDLMMPVMDGTELIRSLRVLAPHLGIHRRERARRGCQPVAARGPGRGGGSGQAACDEGFAGRHSPAAVVLRR